MRNRGDPSRLFSCKKPRLHSEAYVKCFLGLLHCPGGEIADQPAQADHVQPKASKFEDHLNGGIEVLYLIQVHDVKKEHWGIYDEKEEGEFRRELLLVP